MPTCLCVLAARLQAVTGIVHTEVVRMCCSGRRGVYEEAISTASVRVPPMVFNENAAVRIFNFAYRYASIEIGSNGIWRDV